MKVWVECEGQSEPKYSESRGGCIDRGCCEVSFAIASWTATAFVCRKRAAMNQRVTPTEECARQCSKRAAQPTATQTLLKGATYEVDVRYEAEVRADTR